MFRVSAKKLNLWIQNKIDKYGEKESLYLLLDLSGGISKSDLNKIRIDPQKDVYLKENLYSLNLKWKSHINRHKPIQYISKAAYWRDLKLEISKNVLIPRSETEQILDIVADIFKNDIKKVTYADLGTGSGAIAISLAILNPNWHGLATDIDSEVISVAKNNFRKFSKQTNLIFYCGDWWEPLSSHAGEIDLAISNPPYIPTEIYYELPYSVKNYEPRVALDGGYDGLTHIKKIIKDSPKFLKKRGWLIFENHFDQGQKVKNLLEQNGFDSTKIINDLFGIGRFTIARYK